MKFLYIGDFHLCDTPPTSRIDDYHQTLIEKINEITHIAQSNNCTAILQGGDFFNTPRISEEMLATYIREFSHANINDIVFDTINGNINHEELESRLKNSCPLIGVVGNHELFGETMKSFTKTSLYFMESIGMMNLVTKDKPIIFKSSEGFSVAITGANYSHELDMDEDRNEYIIDNKLGDYHIHLVHGMMLDKPNKMYKTYTLASDIIEKTDADITLCGHYHDGFKTVRKNGKYICNSGAIVRQSARSSNMKRKPKVLLIEITKEKGISVTSINLKCAKPADKIFNLEEKERKAKFTEKLEEIKQKVETANVEKGNNITEIVVNIANNKELNEDTKQEVVTLLSDKMKDMMDIEQKNLPKYTIKKLILENFQSHEYSEFEFSEGLNVLTGESGSGKTSVIRALDWIYENAAKNARRYIRADKDFCKATIILSNGYEISRIVEKSPTKGFNGYEVFYPDTQERKRTNTKELPIIQELLGFSKLVVDNSKSSKDIPVNFLKQGSPWFFVGDGNTAPERAKIIGSIYGTQYADSLSKDLEQGLRKNNAFVKEAENTCKDFELSIKQVGFVDEMKENIDKADALIEKITKLMEKKEQLSQLADKEIQINKKIEALNKFLEDTKEVEEKSKSIIDNISDCAEKKATINKRLSEYASIKNKLQVLTQFIQDTNTLDIEKKKEVFEKTVELTKNRQEIVAKIYRLQELSKNLKFNQAKGKALVKFVDETKDIESKKELIDSTIELSKKKDDIYTKTSDVLKKKERLTALAKIVGIADIVIEKSKKLDDISVSLEKKKKIEELYASYVVEASKGKQLRKDIDEYNESIKKEKEVYAEVLKEAGHCPVCANAIEVENIPDIIKANFPE